jgi:hypothetical protein
LNVSYFINSNGEKQEVRAIEYKASVHAGRLICPCCGERVSWNDGRAVCLDGKTRKKCFKHHHGTKRKECENYCIAISQYPNMKPYERIGLPLYLIKDIFSFSLNIGLYGISEVALEQASQLDLTLNILSNKNVISTKKIDNINFVPGIMHYINVSCCSDTYRIEFSSNHIPREIDEKWCKHVNGIGENGAIFEYTKNGGKKVRSEDGLKTNTNYYLLSNINVNSYPSVKFEKIGEIVFNPLRKYLVYKINIKDINSNSLGFCQKFGMELSHMTPQLTPLWPPCIINDQEFVFTAQKNRFFVLKSDDIQIQTVFSQVSKATLSSQRVSENKLMLKSSIRSEDLISIGSSSTSFICRDLSGSLNTNERTIDLSLHDISDNVLEINSSAKVKVIRWNGNVSASVTIIKQDSVEIEKPKRNEHIQILHGLDQLLLIFKEEKQNNSNIEKLDDFLFKVISRNNTNLITIPVSLKLILLNFKCYPKTYRKLQRIINDDKISRETMNILKQQCLRDRGV